MKLIIINGPNLNLLGIRQREIYGKENFGTYFNKIKQDFKNIELDCFQSNSEGDIIDKLHEIGFEFDGIILNAGAYSHTSIAIADAISAITTPVVEVHISNIFSRERFRRHSYMTKNCKGLISGFGLSGYTMAIRSFL
jgi:3-dehydroquinate dehydratase-2